MAAPAKNFTDPSGTPYRLGNQIPSSHQSGTFIPLLVGTSLSFMSQIVLAPKAYFDNRLGMWFGGAQSKNSLDNNVKSKLPPPPMGRQIILTFPPIYKERGGSTAITTGQLYPPHRSGN